MCPYVDHDPKSKGFDYTDASELERRYHGEGMSTRDMADECGVSRETIRYHMKKNDISRRERIQAVKKSRWSDAVAFYTDRHGGYEMWASVDTNVRVHRLLAVAEYGMDAVSGKDVHHKNGVPWDNRPENIELMGHGEHTKHHHDERRD